MAAVSGTRRDAIATASKVGITTALGQAVLWDTMIQHGLGGENGTTRIIRDTRREMGGDATRNEADWLDAFLDVRLRHTGPRGRTHNQWTKLAQRRYTAVRRHISVIEMTTESRFQKAAEDSR